MIKVALITEGVTDQFVIKPIIENYFKDIDFKFNAIQPQIDETDKQDGFGGWVNVIKWCKSEDLKEVFVFNDFVVIQIDADVCQEYDVSNMEKGKVLENRELCEKIIEKLKSFILPVILEQYHEKIIFAIGVYSIECWLVPIIDVKHKKQNVLNCIDKLNKVLNSKKSGFINPKDKNNSNSRKIYHKLANKFKKKEIIDKLSKKNDGFECFVEQLNTNLKASKNFLR
ncbi:MAG: hypothetical protein JXL97_09360 [Bacteroidales bacterium]|nr:hypothetical protein [Bacteroidales bacterium]